MKVNAVPGRGSNQGQPSGCQPLDIGCQLNAWFNQTFAAELAYVKDPIRLVKILVGLGLLLIVVAMLFTPEGQAIGQVVGRPVEQGVRTVTSSVRAVTS